MTLYFPDYHGPGFQIRSHGHVLMSPLPRLVDQAVFTKVRPRRDSGAGWLVSVGASLDRGLRSIFFRKIYSSRRFSPSGLVATSIP